MVSPDLIVSDAQIPYHDPKAVEIVNQVGEDLKVNKLIFNGDMGDYHKIGRYPTGHSEIVVSEMREELERMTTVIRTMLKRIKPKQAVWNDGNHEWRLARAMQQSPQTLQLMGVPSVADAISAPGLLGLAKLKVKYTGPYPHGLWLRDNLPPDNNVWIEHGYIVRKNAAYTVNALMQERCTNVVVGHCHRMGMVWKQVLGRSFFGVEGGNLSLLGIPNVGANIYSSVPHSAPEYMNTQQGFTIIYYDGVHFHPQPIRINDGVAVVNGKVYRA